MVNVMRPASKLKSNTKIHFNQRNFCQILFFEFNDKLMHPSKCELQNALKVTTIKKKKKCLIWHPQLQMGLKNIQITFYHCFAFNCRPNYWLLPLKRLNGVILNVSTTLLLLPIFMVHNYARMDNSVPDPSSITPFHFNLRKFQQNFASI